MATSSWLQQMFLTGTALLCTGIIHAGDQYPDGLPHEVVTLRDGRRLSGHYDPFSAILWIDGPYRARLRLHQGDVIRRMPIADAEPPRVADVPTPGANTATMIAAQRTQTLRLREQQVADLDRRKQETADSIRLLISTLDTLDETNRGLDLALSTQPENSPKSETLVAQQRKVQQQIIEIRRRLTLLQEQANLLTKRREQLAALVARARSAPIGSPTEQLALTDALSDPMFEMRLRLLEDEVRTLRADNQELHRQLDGLLKLGSPPAIEPSPPSGTPVTPPAIPQPAPVEPPAVPENADEITASEQVVRRA
ncbi:MAG TPA: hypothetical protein VHX44_14295 [Planctomycetota bacterium]|nr:hypothetical protein [Planctomycetota bacterium]